MVHSTMSATLPAKTTMVCLSHLTNSLKLQLAILSPGQPPEDSSKLETHTLIGRGVARQGLTLSHLDSRWEIVWYSSRRVVKVFTAQ